MEELLKIIQQQSATIDSLTNKLALLREQVAYLTILTQVQISLEMQGYKYENFLVLL